MFKQEEKWVSKTCMKKRMNDLQGSDIELTKLSPNILKKVGLDEELFETVLAYKKITSDGALKYQGQFIGRLTRDTDPTPIEVFPARLRGDGTAHNAFLQRIEQAHDYLLTDDDAVTQLMTDFSHTDVGRLRTLIRNTRKK